MKEFQREKNYLFMQEFWDYFLIFASIFITTDIYLSRCACIIPLGDEGIYCLSACQQLVFSSISSPFFLFLFI